MPTMERLRARAGKAGRKGRSPRVGREQGPDTSAGGRALQRRELETAEEIYAPDYVGHDPSNPQDVRGLEAAKQAAADYRRAFPDLRVTVEDLIAEGDKVAARLRFRGTHLEEMDGIAPTGKRVECTGIVISRIEGGRIAEDWANFDDLGMMRQLGLAP